MPSVTTSIRVAAVTRAARDAFLLITVPPMPTWVRFLTPAQPAWGGLAALSVALLPRWARRMYSLPGLGLTDAAATATGLRPTATGLAIRPERRSTEPTVPRAESATQAASCPASAARM